MQRPKSDPYATLKVALRHALLRVGGLAADISPLLRAIENDLSLGEATDILEGFIRAS